MKKIYSKPETYYEGMEPEMMIALSIHNEEVADDSEVLSRESLWGEEDEEEGW